jgi:hypothetical protein
MIRYSVGVVCRIFTADSRAYAICPRTHKNYLTLTSLPPVYDFREQRCMRYYISVFGYSFYLYAFIRLCNIYFICGDF